MAANDGNKANFIVGGYDFLTEEDAQKASMDQSKIKLLESRVKVSRPGDILAVYEKAIENKIFKTPIGWRYLTDLREKLLESGYLEEDLIPIPLDISMTRHSAFENLSVKQRVKPTKEKNAELKKILPIVLNVVLVIVVILMFVIASTSENDNIINYKRNITNRYSAWDEELKEREKAVREAEKRLGISDSKGYDESGYGD